MQETEKDKLVELTERAAVISEKLLSNEKRFIEDVVSGKAPSLLEEANERLNELCRKEHLYLSASQFLLKTINKD